MEKKSTLVDSIEQKLLRHISEAGLHLGDRLPSEQQLASQIGVARSVIREGLSRLRALHLLQGNKRGGNVLCHPDVFASINMLSTYHLMTEEDSMNLVAIRVLMEMGAAEFIFQNATLTDINELRDIASGDYATDADADVAFHNRMFAICGNSRVVNFGKLLEGAFADDKRQEEEGVRGKNSMPNHHLTLCDELEHGTSQSFRRALYLHFSSYRIFFQKR